MRVATDQAREVWGRLHRECRDPRAGGAQLGEIQARLPGGLEYALGAAKRVGFVGRTTREVFGANHAQTLP